MSETQTPVFLRNKFNNSILHVNDIYLMRVVVLLDGKSLSLFREVEVSHSSVAKQVVLER